MRIGIVASFYVQPLSSQVLHVESSRRGRSLCGREITVVDLLSSVAAPDGSLPDFCANCSRSLLTTEHRIRAAAIRRRDTVERLDRRPHAWKNTSRNPLTSVGHGSTL